jgi:nitrogen fixation NifU-like protein
MSDLYQEIILEHAQHPHHFGALDCPTHTAKDANASCGDLVEMQITVKNKKITNVGWRGVGCAISTASASILSDLILGKTIEQAKKIQLQDLLKEIGMDSVLPTREKCVMLPLKVLQKF